MGCITSKHSFKDRKKPATFLLELNPRSFRVANVDDDGVEQNYGVLEVRDNDLLFHQSDTLTTILPMDAHSNILNSSSEQPAPIRWPLKSLRRYGFDGDLFSFESGRRCATGPGIYAFRCGRSELLFQLVQDSIVRLGREEEQLEISRRLLVDQHQQQNRLISTTNPHGRLVSNNVDAFNHQLESEVRSNRINDSPDHLTSQQSHHFLNEQHQYINKDAQNYVNAEINPTASQLPNYVNQSDNHIHINGQSFDQSQPSVQYAQLDLPAMHDISRQLSNHKNDDDEDDDDDEEKPIAGNDCDLINKSDDAVGGDGNDENKVPGNGYINVPIVSVFSRSKFLNNSATTNDNFSSSCKGLHSSNNNNSSATMTSTSTTTSKSCNNASANNMYLNITPPSEKINYIQLDLEPNNVTNNNNSSSSSKLSTITSTTSSTASATTLTRANINNNNDCYAVIDMARTQAISNKALLMQSNKNYDNSKYKRFNSTNN